MTMRVGETAKLHIRGDYAYGSGGFPAWGYVIVVFVVESLLLLEANVIF
jgi:FKBP-type peptidyl-prolyl cis-trans isomerase